MTELHTDVATLQSVANLVCGKQLGEGRARKVFVYRLDPTRVIKIEEPGSFQNVLEYSTWWNLKSTAYERYLAPCLEISDCGRVLLQLRVKPLPEDKATERALGIKMSEVRLPSFLTDFKRSNYGVFKGRVVACDYGSTLLLNHGAFGSRMKKPQWWE